MSVLISAIICTHNRAELLIRTIQSLLEQHMAAGQYEIIVVDNRSTDKTKHIVLDFCRNNRAVRYAFEPRLGLSYARNTGWQKARGIYVAYLDDDAVACPAWLDAILATFSTVQPTPGCIGGKVEPIWERERPAWVSDELVTCLTAIDWPGGAQVLTDLGQRWLVGANMALPRQLLRRVGGFAAGLDRAGRTLLSGGDVFLQKQIIRAGYTCYYQPAMLVRHFTPGSRLRKCWFVRRYYCQGLSDAAMQVLECAPSALERPRLAAAKVAELFASQRKILKRLRSGSGSRGFTDTCFTLITLGHIAGLLGALGRTK